MTGYFLNRKYHAAILGTGGSVTNIITMLTSLYQNNIVIEIYNNSKDLFEAINLSKSTNKPFDMAYLDETNNFAEKLILKQTVPSLKIFTYCKEDIKKSVDNRAFA